MLLQGLPCPTGDDVNKVAHKMQNFVRSLDSRRTEGIQTGMPPILLMVESKL